MKLNDFENKRNFSQLPNFIYTFIEENKIKVTDIAVYALAYNMARLSDENTRKRDKKLNKSVNNFANENNEIFFYLVHDTIQSKLKIGKNQSIASIKRLIEAGLIVADKRVRKATKYYIVDHFSDDENTIKFHQKEKDTYSDSDQSEKGVTYRSDKRDSYRSDFGDLNNNNINNNKLNNNYLNNNIEEKMCQVDLFKKFQAEIGLAKNNIYISKFISEANLNIIFNECNSEKILCKFFDELKHITTKIYSFKYLLGTLKNIKSQFQEWEQREIKKREMKKKNEIAMEKEKAKILNKNLEKIKYYDLYDSLSKEEREKIESEAIKANPSGYNFISSLKDDSPAIYLSSIKDIVVNHMSNDYKYSKVVSLS